MKTGRFLGVPTEPVDVSADEKISDLLKKMRCTGFQGRKLAEVTEIWVRMLRKRNCVVWMGLAGAMVPAGMRRVISYLIRRRMIDVLVTTGANLYHDTFEARGEKHYVGSLGVSDVRLRKAKVDRIYDIFADEQKFHKLDNWIEKQLSTRLLDHMPYSSREILEKLGELLEETAREKDSIILDAYRAGVPIYSPALNDSALGFSLMFANRTRGRHIIVDGLKDVHETARITEKAKTTGVIYLGGGVPKNFIQQTAVIASYQTRHDRSHNFAIQITTDMPVWGGLSGCTFEEAQSWGKITRSAPRATCYSDITIALPIVARALAQRFRRLRRTVPHFDWRDGDIAIHFKAITT
jgi:deoxyhypusine synthase